MEDKASQSAQKVLYVKLKRMLADHEKGLKEKMSEQSRKHAAEH
jgi:hypothetical protein